MDNLVLMHQVHGNNVVRVYKKAVNTTIGNCDALITNDKNITLGVRTADCLPISVIDKKCRGIGLIHAGWKGLENGIVQKTISLIVSEFSVDPIDLVIKIGPHICVKHYEVKEDVSTKFEGYPEALINEGGKEFLDLSKVAIIQLVKAGVNLGNIENDERCTFEDPALFSFRKNGTAERILTTLSIK